MPKRTEHENRNPEITRRVEIYEKQYEQTGRIVYEPFYVDRDIPRGYVRLRRKVR